MEATTFIRVRYAETDQMGYVYYGNYAQYFEVARVEFLRSIGLSYKKLEASGVMMPVLSLESRYFHPAKYDDLLRIETEIPEIPQGVRILFKYKVFNENGLLLHEGKTELVFVNMEKNRPCKAPEILIKALENYRNLKDV